MISFFQSLILKLFVVVVVVVIILVLEARAILQQSQHQNNSTLLSQQLLSHEPSFTISNPSQLTTLLPTSKSIRSNTSFIQPTLSSINKIKSQEVSIESRGRARERDRENLKNEKQSNRIERKRSNSLTQLNQSVGTIERKYVNTRLIRSESPTRERNQQSIKGQKSENKQNVSLSKNSFTLKTTSNKQQQQNQQKTKSRFEESFLSAVSKVKKETIKDHSLKQTLESKKDIKRQQQYQHHSNNINQSNSNIGPKESSPIIQQTRAIHLEHDRDIPKYIPVVDKAYSHSYSYRPGTSTVTTTPSDLTVDDGEMIDEFENDVNDFRDERENHEVSYLESWYHERATQNKSKEIKKNKVVETVKGNRKSTKGNQNRLLNEKERSFLLLPHERLQYEKNVRKQLSGREERDEQEGYQDQFLRLKTNSYQNNPNPNNNNNHNVSLRLDERRRR